MSVMVQVGGQDTERRNYQTNLANEMRKVNAKEADSPFTRTSQDADPTQENTFD